jgi:hypothetical protein
VPLDDRARDRQAEACAGVRTGRVRPAREERLEDALPLHLGDPLARVRDLEPHVPPARLGADDHGAARRRVVDRVLDQVEQHPLQLLGVGARGLQAGVELGTHLYAAGLRLRPDGVDGRGHQRVDPYVLCRPVEAPMSSPRVERMARGRRSPSRSFVRWGAPP